jgi:hypothetical protein
MSRIAFIILLSLSAYATCFAQSAYKGLTPGQSTRADVERVLGQPVKSVSKTLVEYKSPEAAGKLFVQYRNDSPAAIVERIEMACPDYACAVAGISQLRPPDEEEDARKVEPPGGWLSAQPPWKRMWYWGAPRFVVYTELRKADNPNPLPDAEVRLGFYSKELYEGAVPKGCTGMEFGTWESDSLGRINIVRDGHNGIRGTYSKNNGSFNLNNVRRGEWKDDTGSGVINIAFRDGDRLVISRRTAGTEQKLLLAEARCAKAQGGGNN